MTTGASRRIEIEFRSRLTEAKFSELQSFLKNRAEDLGEDNRHTYFFLFPDKLLKVVSSASRKTAKIVVKLNKIGRGSEFEEIEVDIKPSDIEKALRIFASLGFADVREFDQKRHNYRYKDIEIALKWSKEWGYHLEFEVMISDLSKKAEAEKRIRGVADELGVRLMTDEELADFTKNADLNYRRGKSVFLHR